MRKGFITGLLASAAVLIAGSGAFAAEPTQTYLISTNGGSYASVDREIGQYGGITSARFGSISQFAARLTATQAAALAHAPGISGIAADGIAHIDATQAPTPSWGLDRTDQANLPLDTAFSYPDTAGAGVRVYIVDTGVQGDNPDFAGRMATGIDEVTPGGNPAVDCHGHGTHTAGTAAGSVYGIAKFATIVPVRVLDCTGSGTYTGIIAGLNWIAANNPVGTPAVVSMSLGGSVSTALNAAIASLASQNITSVVAAGNSNTDACTSSPSSEPTAITVGATDTNDARASFSNYGSCVDLFAPGVNITSDLNSSTGGSQVMSGTSMATPHVTGVVAEYLSLYPNATTAQVTAAVLAGATPNKVTNSLTAASGSGLLNSTFINNLALPATAAPDAPSNLVAGTATGTSIAVSWSAPANTNNNPATSYFVEYKPTSGSTWTGVSTTSTSFTATGLTGATSYDFRVSAVNTIGTSAATAPVSASTLGTAPGTPTGLAVTATTSSSVALQWVAPVNSGSSPITSYKLEYKRSTSSTYTALTVNGTNTTVTGLASGATYNFRVSATNINGTSAPTATVNATTPVAATTPTAPRSLSVSATYGDAIGLRWSAPSNTGGGLTGYTIQRNIAGVWTTVGTTSASITSYVVTGLTPSTSNQFQVYASSAAGNGPAASLTATTGTGVPGKVGTISSSNLTSTGATLSWSALASPNYSTANTYNVTIYLASTGAVVQTLTGQTTNRVTVSGLTTLTSYQVDVTAVNNGVSGATSNKASFKTR